MNAIVCARSLILGSYQRDTDGPLCNCYRVSRGNSQNFWA